MAHNINTVNGRASFFSTQKEWHSGQTQHEVVKGALTAEQAIIKAGMNWEVVKEQAVHPRSGELIDSYNVYRADTDTFLGSVGARYTPVQNVEMFDFMDRILGEDGAHYETAGVLGRGERVFITACLHDSIDVLGTGDKHESFLVSVGSHDGSTSVRTFVNDFRVVCSNTVQLALGANRGKGLSVRHTKNAITRLNSNITQLQLAKATFADYAEKLEVLARRVPTAEVLAKTVSAIFGIKNEDAEVATRTANQLTNVFELFEGNDNNAFPEFRGTAYNLLNAVTEYVDHSRPVRMTDGRLGQTETQMRQEAAVFGQGSDFKSKALDIILEMTEGARMKGATTYSITPTAGLLDSIIEAY